MIEQYFDPTNPKYKGFFGCCHVTTLTKILCWVNILPPLIKSILEPQKLEILILIIFFTLLIYATPFYAIKTDKSLWMVPVLFAAGIQFIVIIFATIFVFVTVFLQGPGGKGWEAVVQDETDYVSLFIAASVVLLSLSAVFISAWIFQVFHGCYEYLWEKKKASLLPMNTI